MIFRFIDSLFDTLLHTVFALQFITGRLWYDVLTIFYFFYDNIYSVIHITIVMMTDSFKRPVWDYANVDIKKDWKEKVDQRYLKDFMDIVFHDGRFHYERIGPFMCGSETIDSYDKSVVALCDSILQKLLTFNLKDSEKVSRLIDLVSIVRDPAVKNLAGNSSNPMNPSIFQTSVNKSMSSALDMREKSDIFHDCKDLNFEQVSRAIRDGDVDMMKVLVRYGACLHLSPKDTKDVISRRSSKGQSCHPTENAALLFSHKCTSNCYNCIQLRLRDHGRRSLLIAGAITSAADYMRSSRSNASEKRENNNFTCFQLYFQAIPDPLVTFEEVENMVHRQPEEYKDYWVLFLKFFKQIPEFNQAHRPRSLMHLCRCRIRTDLAKKGSVPYLVSKLHIPRSLRSLILSDSRDYVL